jgi:hypothetical protein
VGCSTRHDALPGLPRKGTAELLIGSLGYIALALLFHSRAFVAGKQPAGSEYLQVKDY